jgi:UDP-GlcNAc:undecaprenyl-phosphate GlcNAc-1-phosphate transferase
LLTGWISAAIGIGWLLAYTNQFNFMDGSDGLAAGMSVVNALGIAALAVAAGRADIAWCALILAAAAAGFLWHNIAPASIFMGDTGSHVLGFTLALLVIFLIEAGVRPLAAVVLLAPFVIDTMVTLVRRWARGEVLWRAHRSHLYQHLLMNGWTARQVAWIYYAWGVWSALVAWLMTLTAYSGWAENAALVGAQLVPATIVARLAARSLPRLDHQIQPEPVAQRSDQPSGIHAPGQRGHR